MEAMIMVFRSFSGLWFKVRRGKKRDARKLQRLYLKPHLIIVFEFLQTGIITLTWFAIAGWTEYYQVDGTN